MRLIAQFYDDQMQPATEPFNTRAFPLNWPDETLHKVAREYGKKHGWHFYRLGKEWDWDMVQLQEQFHKVWRHL